MFNNNLIGQSNLNKNSIINTSSTRMLKEITILQQRKLEICHRVEEIESRRKLVNTIKQQIEVNRQITTTIELDLNTLEHNVDKFKRKLNTANVEKLELVIHLEHEQHRLESIGKQLIQFFKHQPMELDSIRLQMIQIESDDLKRFQSVFSLREVIVAYLKDKIQFQSQYDWKYGAQLQISARGLTQDFKRIVMNRLDDDTLEQFKPILLKSINRYIAFLKQAQFVIKSIQTVNKVSPNTQEDLQTIQQKIVTEKHQIMQLQRSISQLCKIITQLQNKIQLLQQIINNRKRDKNQANSTIERLNIRTVQISQQPLQTDKLIIELAEINQAIAYLSSKRFCNENFNELNIQSYKQIEWQNQPSTSPSRITSLDLLVKSKINKNKETSKVLSFKSPNKVKNNNINITSLHNLGSPSWK